MEVIALSFRLTLIVMILMWAHDPRANAASFEISPSRLQFFEYELLTLYCMEDIYYGVVHKPKGIITSCKTTKKLRKVGFACTNINVYPEDSGEYWCEAVAGNRSNVINITVTAGSVILESPALPVMEGESVTLSCRNKTASSNFTADFYRDGLHISSSSTGSVTIYRVSRSDAGHYKCGISGVGESAESWLAVRAGSVILEIPALPVMEGESVTLSCRINMTSSDCTADFYKDGFHISNSSTGNMTIRKVSKSDEGLYKCGISGVGQSGESWLAVRGHCSCTQRSEKGCHVYIMLRTIVTSVMVFLLLLLLGLLHCGKFNATGHNAHPRRSNKLSELNDKE